MFFVVLNVINDLTNINIFRPYGMLKQGFGSGANVCVSQLNRFFVEPMLVLLLVP